MQVWWKCKCMEEWPLKSVIILKDFYCFWCKMKYEISMHFWMMNDARMMLFQNDFFFPDATKIWNANAFLNDERCKNDDVRQPIVVTLSNLHETLSGSSWLNTSHNILKCFDIWLTQLILLFENKPRLIGSKCPDIVE